jgi:SAM-dependent methyltransferase
VATSSNLEKLLVEGGITACCAALYESPAVRWFLGDELHPGGEAATRRSLELIELRPGERLLDVGSGMGSSALLAAREFGCLVAGLDYGADAVRGARRAADTAGLCDRVSFVAGEAGALPFADGEFDATMAVLSDHHWEDRAGGLRELRRVASRRAVVFTWDQAYVDAFWLTRDYLPGFRRLPGMPLEEVAEHLGATRIQPVPLAHDWGDGFLMAFWRRPEAYLDATVRDGISCFGLLPDSEVAEFEATLRGDLSSGAWVRRNEALLDLEELDLGFRLVIAEYA